VLAERSPTERRQKEGHFRVVDRDLEEALTAITLRRAQVLRLLAEVRSEREIAEELHLTLAGVRSHIEDLKHITGHRSTRDLARWWQNNRVHWLNLYAQQAGLDSILGHAGWEHGD
jgi:DNA-binding CsgD family transcriptional regulator